VPDSVKPLNDLLGVPDFFPTRGAPEERLTQESLMNGYQEPNTVSEVRIFSPVKNLHKIAEPPQSATLFCSSFLPVYPTRNWVIFFAVSRYRYKTSGSVM
jgi:hypothetical protein